MYVLLSLGLGMITAVVILPALWYLEDNSRFFESLLFLLSYFRYFVLLGFYGVMMLFFMFLFYHYERKKYLISHLNKITKEIQLLASREMTSANITGHNEFQELADGVNRLVIKSEEAIHEVKKVEQLKNELITNVAHDLRSPLTSILGYVDLINNDHCRDEVELRYYVQIIHDKAASLHSLINDIFEYTYVQNQQVIIQKQSIHIEEIINQLAVQSRLQLEEAGMEWRLYSTATDPVVLGDGGKLARVFENLIQNAIRYGSEGKYLDVRLSDTEDKVTIEVVNYGDPIPSIDIPHIFERFYRVEKSRSHDTGGSGLGLAIAKSIIDLHGGHIEVNSSPGTTIFKVELMK